MTKGTHRYGRLTLLLVGAAVGGLVAGPASADPTGAKNGEIITVVCEEIGTLAVATNGHGAWTPGLVITSQQVGIPYELHISGSFTPTGGSTETFTEDSVKNAPRNGRLDTCTFHESGSDEFGTFSVDGVVRISYTPA